MMGVEGKQGAFRVTVRIGRSDPLFCPTGSFLPLHLRSSLDEVGSLHVVIDVVIMPRFETIEVLGMVRARTLRLCDLTGRAIQGSAESFDSDELDRTRFDVAADSNAAACAQYHARTPHEPNDFPWPPARKPDTGAGDDWAHHHRPSSRSSVA